MSTLDHCCFNFSTRSLQHELFACKTLQTPTWEKKNEFHEKSFSWFSPRFFFFLFSLAVLFIFKHLTKENERKRRERREEIKHENLPLDTVCTFHEMIHLPRVTVLAFVRESPSRLLKLWVIEMTRWAIFHQKGYWQFGLRYAMNMLTIIKYSPLGGFAFICFSYTAKRSLFFYQNASRKKEKKNWDFNFCINIASSFIRIKVQIQRYQLCIARLEDFLLLEIFKVVAGGGFFGLTYEYRVYGICKFEIF